MLLLERHRIRPFKGIAVFVSSGEWAYQVAILKIEVQRIDFDLSQMRFISLAGGVKPVASVLRNLAK